MDSLIAIGATASIIPEVPCDTDAVCEKIKAARALGKRNFIVIVSEGLGKQFAPELADKIETVTGIETKFARLAHIVRGGNPNLKDRVLASEMGVYAVEELLRGNSNIVICERRGSIISVEIRYALILDRMYKGKLVEGDLDAFTDDQRERMRAEVERKKNSIKILHAVSERINL